MISGFNSDIEFQGTVYHVQTEDKGLTTPIILSLVYSRGEILASKRSPYDDLIAAGFDEAELNDRLQRQHKLIIAAIRGGRIDDLKRMTMKESRRKRSAKLEEGQLDLTLVDDGPQLESPPQPAQLPTEELAEETRPVAEPALTEAPIEEEELLTVPPYVPPIELAVEPAVEPAMEPAIEGAGAPMIKSPLAALEAAPIPKPQDDLIIDIPISVVDEPFFDIVEVVEYGDLEEETIMPAEAVKIITDHVGMEEDDDTKLKIRLLGRTTFHGGENTTLDILIAHGGKLGKGVGGAHIVVKVLGSTFRPLIFHTRADDNGIAQVHLQIPDFNSGRAAILIKALYEGKEIELRQVISRR